MNVKLTVTTTTTQEVIQTIDTPANIPTVIYDGAKTRIDDPGYTGYVRYENRMTGSVTLAIRSLDDVPNAVWYKHIGEIAE
jgi:hypothetical protein